MSSFHLLNRRPTANTAVLLNSFLFRVFNNLLYPLHPYHRPVRAPPHFLEVLCEFHFRIFFFWANVSRFCVSSALGGTVTSRTHCSRAVAPGALLRAGELLLEQRIVCQVNVPIAIQAGPSTAEGR